MNLCQCVGNILAAAPDWVRTAVFHRERLALDSWSELLNYEFYTKVFHVNCACFVGAINGSRFAPMVFEMPEM